MLSPDATLMIAEYAYRLTLMPVLEKEKDYRQKSKDGRKAVGLDKQPYTTSPNGNTDVPRTRSARARPAPSQVA